jgi:mono/diheme cytochrome c family protein
MLGILLSSLGWPGCEQGQDGRSPPAVPTALFSPQARERGRQLFQQHCVLCHGLLADGHGLRREGLSTPPRDFTDPLWRRRIEPGQVFGAIRNGIRGTSMPPWSGLGDQEIWDLAAYVLSISEQGP